MRIISGFLKGRSVGGYDVKGTRPTMDRVKESVFASIQSKIPKSIVLDLFSGSGSLGIEAISNGADCCYFVDDNPKIVNILKENIRNFNIEDKCYIINKDYYKAIRLLKDKNIGILITDHNALETLRLTDRAYLLFEGKILFLGTPEELAENPVVREKYLGTNFVLRRKDFQLAEKDRQENNV